MKRKIVCLLSCLLYVVLLAGCGNEGPEATDPQVYRTELPYNLTLETWNPTMGNPNYQKATPMFEIQTTASGEMWIDEVRYMPLSYLWNRKETKYTSGWKIQLDKLNQVGTFTDLGYIYSNDCENPPVIFTHHPFMGDVALYFRPDIAQNGITAFSFDEFNVIENTSPYENDVICSFWNVHTGHGDYEKFTGMWLDADFSKMQSYYVLLEHKTFPAVTYQMKFCVYEDFLMIENFNANTVIYVKLADIQPSDKG